MSQETPQEFINNKLKMEIYQGKKGNLRIFVTNLMNVAPNKERKKFYREALAYLNKL